MYLTYIPTTEGIGAQYQRILAIIGIGRACGIGYKHTPIPEVGHNPGIDNWSELWDRFFGIGAMQDWTPNQTEAYVFAGSPSLYDIVALRDQGHEIVLGMNGPLDIVDQDPNMFYGLVLQDARRVFWEQNVGRPLVFRDGHTSIAIHLRVYNRFDECTRDLYTNEYAERYERIIQKLCSIYKSPDIYIFTQEPYEHSVDLSRFEAMSNVRVLKDYDTFDTFYHMASADVVILNKSSFSYLAGMYNPNTVYYIPFWHPPMHHWVSIQALES